VGSSKNCFSFKRRKRFDASKNINVRFISWKKKQWDPARPFSADYMDVKTNLHQQQFHEAIQLLFSRGGDSHIYFANAVHKVNRYGASQLQVLVATDHHLYKYEPKKYKMIKAGVPFQAVKDIYLSPLSDTYVVIQMDPPYRDMVLDMGGGAHEYYSELCTILYQHRKLLGRAPSVEFKKAINFNNSRTKDDVGEDITLTFEAHLKPHPGCTFKGPHKGTAVVHYDPGFVPIS